MPTIPLVAWSEPALAKPAASRIGYHQRRASLGVWAAMRRPAERRDIIAWKTTWPYDMGALERLADATTALVREWSGGVLPTPAVVTVPPRGASLHGAAGAHPYAAELLACAVADRLALPFQALLGRTDVKARHCIAAALEQAPFRAEAPTPAGTVVLIVDDLVTSGTTMKLSLQALRSRGVPAFGFAYSGV